ncbi:GAF and ANTAR domain-containing protein [Mycobacteroides abscessus subsp. abscessus]|nr:GAF and ANTAR domain-containing protein [Mycobacteroides abscessus subsp. abscessus]
MSRIHSVADGIDGLRAIRAAEEPLEDALRRVADTAVRMTPDADAVTVTVFDDESAAAGRTAACTDPAVLELDESQYSSHRGPCLHAAQAREPLRMRIDPTDQRWPEFASAATTVGVRASLSVPLLIGVDVHHDQELAGSLNIYSRSADAFDPFDEELVRLYSVAAGQAISNGRRWQQSRNTLTQLEQALVSRSTIDQAKGALRAIHGYTAEEAFAALVEQSQHRNVKLHIVASEFLDSLTTPQGR